MLGLVFVGGRMGLGLVVMGVLRWFVWAVLHWGVLCWSGRLGVDELTHVHIRSLRAVVLFGVVNWFLCLQAFFCVYLLVFVCL